MTPESLVLPLDSPLASLASAGGKGASLARLLQLGLPVPPGFIITTVAYRLYLSENRLQEKIDAILADLPGENLAALEQASAAIRTSFTQGCLPTEFRQLILEAAAGMEGGPLAVRSSATTEDLPELSFAGQQDTFLNVAGEPALLKAVVDCWSSLWTARAIGYRLRNAVPGEGLALAVVVQRMVASDVSGVLFTANPLTGLRRETVIDAAYGLGEGLVSGMVSPDHIVADSASGHILRSETGEKQFVTRAAAGGGVETIGALEALRKRQALSEVQVKQLVEAGQAIQAASGGDPQDIEWAFSNDKLYILQSRPVTSLYPVPLIQFDPLRVWFSFGAVQGISGPLTPLGQDTLKLMAVGFGKSLGVSQMTFANQDFVASAGERIWMNVTGIIRNPVSSRIIVYFMGVAEPGTANIMERLYAEPGLGAGTGRVRLRTLGRLLRFLLPVMGRLPRVVARPDNARQRLNDDLDEFLALMSIPGGADRSTRLENLLAYMEGAGPFRYAFHFALQRFLSIMVPSMASLNLISHLLPSDSGGQQGFNLQVMDVTRGMPGNVTTEMDLRLWAVSRRIQADPDSAAAFAGIPPAELSSRLLQGSLPPAAQQSLQGFLDSYGMHAAGEIDLGRRRWQEDPTPVLAAVKSYLTIPLEDAPDAVFARNAAAAEAAVEKMAAAVRRLPVDRFREALLRGAARRVRLLLGGRESPKFFFVRILYRIHQAMLAIGQEFVSAGTLSHPDDLFYLHLDELYGLTRDETLDWQALVASRRDAFEREERRKQAPRILVSDGRVFYEGAGSVEAGEDVLSGSPVSPGVVEGRVRVVLDPRQARLESGDILVCPGTDPAWTPLFMAAVGLVMEVGGMMTHGSVVAREYGIPAVVGVAQATTRLEDGQRIRLDGSLGTITLLED